MKEIKFDEKLITNENLVSWNNKVALYLDKNTIPKNIKNLIDLNYKHILYYIVTKKNMIYIGMTDDFGQRVQCHAKDSRGNDVVMRKMHKDVQLYGNAIVGILGVYDNRKELRASETLLIQEYKDKYLTEKFGNEYQYLVPIEEQENYLFTKFYNIQN